jgi:glycosyltransferase involved in cell wall biosynthesis
MYHADLLGGLAGRTLKIPVIWNLRHSSLKRGHNRQSTIAVARANALLSRYVPRKIVAVSEEAARSHSKFGYDGSKMCVIPNGFDTGIFSPSVGSSLRSKLGLSREHLLVGMVGRFHPLKNHRLFVEAAARIHHSLPSTRFLLCGKDLDSHNTDLVNWIREAGIEKQFFLLGYREDIPEVLGSLDLFLSTSWSEGFPNSLGEAMSCGVPCLATDVGGTSQLLKDPSLLVLPGDALALSHSVLNLLSLSSKERESVGMALRERVKTHFSLSAASKGYRRLYEEVLKR